MTHTEFKQAADIAMNHPEIDLSQEEIAHFDGFSLPGFEPVICTSFQLARLIRWQCGYIGGGFDAGELNQIRRLGKRLFQII